jgi:hypothetical protein
MPSWNDILVEINACPLESPLDKVRRKYLLKLSKHTGRNVIAYYSGFLQKPGVGNTQINDDDKNGFMATIHTLDRSKGLDLILHTPGGDIAATESIVHYIRQMFGLDVRAIIPQIAMSAGTMIACSCKQIIMGKQSNIGPIDPQFNGIPCYGVLDEFKRALDQVKLDPAVIPIWQTVISKYHPTFIGECQNAIDWSSQIVKVWLAENMFKDRADPSHDASEVVNKLSDHDGTKTHARHIHLEEAERLALDITKLENDPDLQDLVLTVHHAYMHSFANSNCARIIENHIGRAIIFSIV